MPSMPAMSTENPTERMDFVGFDGVEHVDAKPESGLLQGLTFNLCFWVGFPY